MRPPFLINYGVAVDEWSTNFRGPGFPIDPWSLDHLVVEASDPAASASWLAGVLGLSVLEVGQGAVGVPLPGCTIAFVHGPANRITRVVLAGADAPVGEVDTAIDVRSCRWSLATPACPAPCTTKHQRLRHARLPFDELEDNLVARIGEAREGTWQLRDRQAALSTR